MTKSICGLSTFVPSKTLLLSSRQAVRSASLTSAINRGKRKTRAFDSNADRRFRDEISVVRYHGAKGETWAERDTTEPFEDKPATASTGRPAIDKPAVDTPTLATPREDGLSISERNELSSSFSKPGRFMALPSRLREPSLPGDRATGLSRRREEAATKTHMKLPAGVPYTTPASEFIYGTSAIRSVLRCGRRKSYNLYIYDGMLRPDKDKGPVDEPLAKLALLNDVRVKHVAGDWIRLLDKMSSGRPHNGYILEASPLPKLPIINYEPVDSPTAGSFSVTLGHQSQEEEDINGTNNQIPSLGTFTSSPTETPTHRYRYPLTLLLDGILDPGNLGAIIRSAYYLGVDAITFAARNSAPFSPVTIKASAGAAENIPLLSVINTVQFVDKSRANGWRFFASEAPGAASSMRNPGQTSRARAFPTHTTISELSQALTESPCVLMLGGEGMGLSSNLRKRADTFIGIPGARTGDFQGDIAGVDSLNVSVASALLCDAFLRAPVDVAAANQKNVESNPAALHETATPSDGETEALDKTQEAEQEPDAEDDERLF